MALKDLDLEMIKVESHAETFPKIEELIGSVVSKILTNKNLATYLMSCAKETIGHKPA